MLTPNPNLSLPSLAPLVTLSLFSVYVSLYLFCEKSILFFFLDSTKKWHHMIFIFFCLTYVTLGPSVLLQMALFYSFYGQIIFHYVCVCVYTHHTFFIHWSVVRRLGCFHVLLCPSVLLSISSMFTLQLSRNQIFGESIVSRWIQINKSYF